VDRHTRKDLKTDKFAREVGHTFEFISEHSGDVKKYGAIAVAVIVLGLGIFFYMRHQAGVREEALTQAMRTDEATVAANPPQPGTLNFATAEEKEKARSKAFSELVAKYNGTQEGAIAEFYLASDAVDKGNLAEAEKRYKSILDSAPKAYASMARIALANVYAAQGKDAEAEKLFRAAVANPTITVSKENATIQLATFLAKKKPAEARKLLEPLRTERTAVSRAAVQVLGEIPQQ
jgi:predicted negative regulator of RcsB-dependent stress response